MLPFYSALNPFSEHSGIVYCLAKTPTQQNFPAQGQEMLDTTISDNISKAFFEQQENFAAALHSTFEILCGNHYDMYLKGRNDCQGGAKGVLDLLLFPLVSRKLFSDTFTEERSGRYLTNLASWLIALPLELVRLITAVVLTIVLAPIVGIVHMAKPCFTGDAQHSPIKP